MPGSYPERQGVTAPLESRARRTMMRLIAAQLAVSLGIAATVAAAFGADKAYAALVGTLIGVVPNYYFAGRLARRRRDATAMQSLRDIYVGEFIKIAFTSALFVMAIMLLNVDFLVVVMTYLAVVMVNWFALLVINLGEQGHTGLNPAAGVDGHVGRNTGI